MKQLFSIFLLFISLSAKAQYFAPLDTRSTGARSSGIIAIDSMWNLRVFDTSTAKLAFPNSLRGRVARQSGRVYYNPTGLRFVLLDSINLSVYVKYSDTATMLAPYVLTSELTNQTGDAGTLQNLHITGTNGNGYLLFRHQASDPTATGQTTVLFSDANGDLKWKNDGKFYTTLRDFKNTADRVYSFEDKSYTLADSAVVAGKLNIADTANIRLRPIAGANMSITGTYPNLTFASAGGGGGGADSITFATNYRVDTAKANLRASIATKLNIADTATMLTPYLRKVDTTAMLGGYLRKVDTASLSNRINTKLNITDTTAMLANYIVNGVNGLTKSGKNLTLGGSLTGATTITTTGSNTLAIAGLSSGTTNDSIVVADPSTGALKRISSSRIVGGSSGWGLTGNAGTTAGTSYVGTSDNVNFEIRSNALRQARFYAATYGVALGEDATATGFWGNAFGYGATASGQHGVAIGSYTGCSDVGAIAVGYGAKAPNFASFNLSSNGGSGNYTTTVSRQGLLGADTRIDMQITPGVNILSVDANNITAQKPVILKSYTVATLPSAAANTGAICYVTDASAPTYNAPVTGGGAVLTIVFSNGTNWTCH